MTDLVPELPPTPRAVRLRGVYRFWRWLLVVLLVALPPGVYLAMHGDALELQQLADHGVMAAGRVQGKHSQRSGKSGRSYYVDYGFVVGDKSWQGAAKVSKSSWDDFAENDPVQICCLPEDPRINRLGRVSAHQATSAATMAWLAAVLALVGLGIGVAVLEKNLRRQLNLLRDGRVVSGRVTAYQRKRSRKQRDRLGYSFRPPASGADIERTERLPERVDPQPEVGQELVVLQLPNDPRVFASWLLVRAYVTLAR